MAARLGRTGVPGLLRERPFPAPARSGAAARGRPPAGRGVAGFEWRGGKMAASLASPRAAQPRPRRSAAAAPEGRGGLCRPAPPLPAALC